MNTMVRRLMKAGVALALLFAAGAASAQIKINEIRIDQSGDDSDEYLELIGPPHASLAGLTYIVLGDTGTVATCGFIESIADLGSLSLQADGLLCIRNSNSIGTPALAGYDAALPMAFENNDNVTHMLVSGFTGTLRQKLDTNDDGTLDITPWTSIVDCIGLNTGTAPTCNEVEYLYCGTTIGPDNSHGVVVPYHVYRYSDTQQWTIGVWSPLGTTDTPGSNNPSLSNPPPFYVDMTRDPCVPLINQATTVFAVVENNPTSAQLRYQVNGGAETALAMEVWATTGDTVYFYTQIPGQATNGARIDYYCKAWNTNPNPTQSYDQGYFVGTMTVSSLRVNDANGGNLYRYLGARVRGRVTVAYGAFGSTNTDYYVQDATGGINVFKFGPHLVHPALGDSVTVVGTLGQYNGKLELTAGGCDTVLVTIHGSGSPPAPLEVNACVLGEQHEGRLVKVKNLFIDPLTDLTFVGNRSYKSVNCFNTMEMFVDLDTNIPGTPITSAHIDVVGIAGQFDTSMPYDYWYQVQPRSLSDMTFLSPTSTSASGLDGGAELWTVAPNPFGRFAEIRYRVPAGAPGEPSPHVRLAIYDLRGRAIAALVDGPVTPGVHVATVDRDAIDVGGSGIVFCRFEVGNTVITRKLVMMR